MTSWACPNPPAARWIGGQGAHAQGVRVLGQDPPGVGGVQVRLAAVAVGHPADPDRPEDAGHAPAVPCLHGAVPDPGRARDLPRSAPPARCPGRTWPPAAAAAAPGPPPRSPPPAPRGPGTPPRPPPRPAARRTAPPGRQRRRQLPVHRDLAPVLPDLHYRHREPHRHRRASDARREWFPPMIPETAPEPADPAAPDRPGYAPGRPLAPLPTSTDHSRQRQKRPESPDAPNIRAFNPISAQGHTC